nr:hypothetical protein [uncultured Lacibacter sp.]
MRKIFTILLLLFSSSGFSQHQAGVTFSTGINAKSSNVNGRLTDSRILRYPSLGTAAYKTSFLYNAGIVYRYKFQKWQAEASLNYQQNNVRTDFSNFHSSVLLRVNTVHPSVAIIRDIVDSKKFGLSAKLGVNTGFTLAKRTSSFENYQFEFVNPDTAISREIIGINANRPSVRFAGVFSLQAAIPLSKTLAIEFGAGVYNEFNKPNKLYHYEYIYNTNPQSEWELGLESDRYNERYLFLQLSVFKKIGTK